MSATIDRVINAAKDDARMFVEEFGQPIDTAQTDWDGAAWTDAQGSLQLTCQEAESLWPVYQSVLTAETRRLAEGRAERWAQGRESYVEPSI